MDVYSTEEEQIEQLKRLWKQYGSALLLAVAIGMALSLGMRYWQQQRNQVNEQASTLYEQVLVSAASDKPDAAVEQAGYLTQQYASTPYAAMAALIAAKVAVDKNNLEGASQHLTWVTKHARMPALKQVARLRLARLLLAQKQPQAALDELKQVDDDSYQPAIAEVQGDAYIALSQIDNARKAYEQALASLGSDVAGQARPLLQMKLANLAHAKSAKSNT